MHFIKPFDPDYSNVAQAFALLMRDYMQKVASMRQDRHWAQEAVMLAMIDGVATIGSSMGYPVEALKTHLGERYKSRQDEMRAALGGVLKEPGKIVL